MSGSGDSLPRCRAASRAADMRSRYVEIVALASATLSSH